MSSPIDHHYLPIFYQKAWAQAGGRVYRYHRPENKPVVCRLIAPKGTGYEKHLYSISDANGNKISPVESYYFSKLDSQAAIVLKKLLEGGLNSLNISERSYWTRFLMSLQLRSPQAIDEINIVLGGILERNLSKPDDTEYLKVREIGDPDSMFDWLQNKAPNVLKNAPIDILPSLIDHQNVGNHLINMYWGVIDLSTSHHKLFIGDRPFIGWHGWKHHNALLCLPLSPNLLFVAVNSPPLAHRLAADDPTQTVVKCNDLMARMAVNMVLADSDNHLRFIENRLRKKDQKPSAGPMALHLNR